MASLTSNKELDINTSSLKNLYAQHFHLFFFYGIWGVLAGVTPARSHTWCLPATGHNTQATHSMATEHRPQATLTVWPQTWKSFGPKFHISNTKRRSRISGPLLTLNIQNHEVASFHAYEIVAKSGKNCSKCNQTANNYQEPSTVNNCQKLPNVVNSCQKESKNYYYSQKYYNCQKVSKK